jgi:hypothetical protein
MANSSVREGFDRIAGEYDAIKQLFLGRRST